MSKLWIPPSARGFEEVAPGVEVKGVDAEQADRLVDADSGVFLPVKDLGTFVVPDSVGPDSVQKAGAELPSVEVEFERLRQQVLDGTAEVELYGILTGFDVDGQTVEFEDGLRAYLQMSDCHLYIGPVPDDWAAAAALAGFAVTFEDYLGKTPWLATGPMGGAHEPIVLPGGMRVRRGAKVGRNQPCPCGSGIKFKRCCGR